MSQIYAGKPEESNPRREKTYRCMKVCGLGHSPRPVVGLQVARAQRSPAHRSEGVRQGWELESLLQAGGRS